MNEEIGLLLARARRELRAVRVLSEADLPEQAISRSYYAVFYAAEAALLSLGQARSKHSGVIAAFSQFVVRGGDFDAAVSRTLRDLFDLRNRADYDSVTFTSPAVEATSRRATEFVTAVAQWLES